MLFWTRIWKYVFEILLSIIWGINSETHFQFLKEIQYFLPSAIGCLLNTVGFGRSCHLPSPPPRNGMTGEDARAWFCLRGLGNVPPSPVSWAWPLHTSVLSMSSCKQLLTAQSISATNRKLLTGWTPRLAQALYVLYPPQSHWMVSVKLHPIPGEREKKNPSFIVSPITPFAASSHHLVFSSRFWSIGKKRSHSVSYLSTL